jgi:hypothetical protein
MARKKTKPFVWMGGILPPSNLSHSVQQLTSTESPSASSSALDSKPVASLAAGSVVHALSSEGSPSRSTEQFPKDKSLIKSCPHCQSEFKAMSLAVSYQFSNTIIHQFAIIYQFITFFMFSQRFINT